jgi:hypothetical protein
LRTVWVAAIYFVYWGPVLPTQLPLLLAVRDQALRRYQPLKNPAGISTGRSELKLTNVSNGRSGPSVYENVICKAKEHTQGSSVEDFGFGPDNKCYRELSRFKDVLFRR